MKNEETKLEIINYIEKASVVILGLLFILFPLVFTNLTTDFFSLPKQALLIFAFLALFLLYGIKVLLSEKVTIRRTPFDVPVIVFILALLGSVIFSVGKIDSFINFMPVLFAMLSYFAIVFNVKNEKSLLVLIGSLLAGGLLASIVTLFSYFKVYLFPFDFTKIQTFTTVGSVLDQAVYLALLIPLGLYFVVPILFTKKRLEINLKKDSPKIIALSLATIGIVMGLIISVYSLLKLQSLPILPINTGFQTALSAISQDSTRAIQALVFGSGFGEFLTVFTRFKQASFNITPYWSLSFIRSSSFVLELLATTGLAGLAAFLFLSYRIIKSRPLFIPVIILLAASFLVPFSFLTITLLFFMLGIFASFVGLLNNKEYFDVELELVALKKGFFAFAIDESSKTTRRSNKALATTVFSLIVVLSLIFSFLTYDYLSTNISFEKSLVFASQNNGQKTYDLQNNALKSITGRYIDSYYRVFSQTNLALANSLASSIPQGQQPNQQTTQTIYTLVQQSINAGRQATTLGPVNTLNWQNLATIYRALIGFGQNADSFAVVAQQQATQLDPTNPQNFVTLGGIYYQLKSWDNAQQQFQQAVTLKSDWPNAYYNLGHVLQEKGDLKGALAQYQIVRQLVSNDQANLAKINSEISTLESQINQPQATSDANAKSTNPLTTSDTTTTLPKQTQPVKIPGPSEKPTPTPTREVSPTPTP